MKAFFHIWGREYQSIFGDTGVLLIFFGAILAYPLIYPIPYSHEVLRDVPVAVVDMDHSQLSRRLIRMMDANELLRIASFPTSLTEARDQFFRGSVNGIVVIPRDFTKNILRKQQAVVAAYCDASYFLLYRQVLTGVLYATGTLSAGIEVKRMMAKGFTTEQAMTARDPVPLLSYPLFNPSGGYASYVVPPVLMLILQQTLLIGIGMLGGTVRERKGRHFLIPEEQSAGVVSLLLGKSAAYLSLYIIHAVYFFVVLRLYQFPQRGEPVELFLFMLPFLTAVIFLGLTIAALFRNREISMVALLFTSIPVLFLAGFSWPPESIPQWLRILSFMLPSTAGIDGFLKLNIMGATLPEVGFQWTLLWGLTGIYFTVACLTVRYIAKKGKVQEDVGVRDRVDTGASPEILPENKSFPPG